ASVVYWIHTEAAGQGDLRPYAFVQFAPMLVLPLLLYLFPARHRGLRPLLWAFGWYAVAKVLEHFDDALYALTSHTVSGHTLKHLAAAAGAAALIGYVRA